MLYQIKIDNGEDAGKFALSIYNILERVSGQIVKIDAFSNGVVVTCNDVLSFWQSDKDEFLATVVKDMLLNDDVPLTGFLDAYMKDEIEKQEIMKSKKE